MHRSVLYTTVIRRAFYLLIFVHVNQKSSLTPKGKLIKVKQTRQTATESSAEGRSNTAWTFDAMYTELRKRICLLIYPPGTMLSESTLATEFGVSRTPIRRVLQRLEFDSLVVSKHGIGTMVTAIDLPYLKDVYALRLKLIDLVGELSPARVSTKDFIILGELLDATQTLMQTCDPAELGHLYLRFNEELSRAIGNKPLREIADRLFYQTSRVWLQILPDLDWKNEVYHVQDEITRVNEALRAGDMREVAKVRREHFIKCLERINRYLRNVDGSNL
jgi:DNA-binding GntR family transcriptional regulator